MLGNDLGFAPLCTSKTILLFIHSTSSHSFHRLDLLLTEWNGLTGNGKRALKFSDWSISNLVKIMDIIDSRIILIEIYHFQFCFNME